MPISLPVDRTNRQHRDTRVLDFMVGNESGSHDLAAIITTFTTDLSGGQTRGRAWTADFLSREIINAAQSRVVPCGQKSLAKYLPVERAAARCSSRPVRGSPADEQAFLALIRRIGHSHEQD